MPTKNLRFTVALPESLLNAVTEYQHIYRLPTQNRAINELLSKGIDIVEVGIDKECKDLGLPPLLQKYNALDSHGRRMVDLVLNEEYTRCIGHNDKSDLDDPETIAVDRDADAIKNLSEREENS